MTIENSVKLRDVLVQYVDQNVDTDNDEQNMECVKGLLAFLALFWVGATEDSISNDVRLITMLADYLPQCREIYRNSHKTKT
jgi:hypothetical protein